MNSIHFCPIILIDDMLFTLSKIIKDQPKKSQVNIPKMNSIHFCPIILIDDMLFTSGDTLRIRNEKV
jgi:hypothetical protein